MRARAIAWLPLLVLVTAPLLACGDRYPAGHRRHDGGRGGTGGSGEGAGGSGEGAGGSGGGGAGGDDLGPIDPSPVARERACETWALAQCRAKARCHEIPARYVDVCVEQLVESDCFGRFVPGLTEGLVRYDGDAWGRCLARLADTAHCSSVLYQNVYLSQDRDCRAAFEGTVPAGEPCSARAWCASGTCDFWGACPSRCLPTGREGEDCEHDWDCASPFLCEDGRCRGPGGEGDRCEIDYSDTPTGQCRDGLFCANSRCTAPLPEGAPCQEYGLACDAGLRCGWPTGRCERPPGPGEACDNGDSEPCRHDLGCDVASGVCVEGRGPGEPCTAGLTPWRTGCALVFQCVEESFRSGHCGRGPRLGEACAEDGSLRCEGSLCQDGVCRGSAISGYRCDDLHPCGSGACEAGYCVRAACASGGDDEE